MRKRHVHWQNTSHCISIVIALDTITAYYIWFNRGINRVLINGFYSVCTANRRQREKELWDESNFFIQNLILGQI